MHAADLPPAAEYDAVVAWRAAIAAAQGAAWAGFCLVAMTGLWIAWVVNTDWNKTAEVAALQDGSSAWRADALPLIVSSDVRVTLPAAIGFALVLLGPFVAGFASIRLRRDLTRAPARAGLDLAMLVGGCAFSVLPGLMVQIQVITTHTHGGGSAGLGPSPMCGGLALLIAAYAGVVLLRHGATLREGLPAGMESAA